jgi:hypothetical protein
MSSTILYICTPFKKNIPARKDKAALRSNEPALRSGILLQRPWAPRSPGYAAGCARGTLWRCATIALRGGCNGSEQKIGQTRADMQA